MLWTIFMIGQSDKLQEKAAPHQIAESPSADLAILQKESAAHEDDYLRLAADFDNFKKCTRRDSERQATAESRPSRTLVRHSILTGTRQCHCGMTGASAVISSLKSSSMATATATNCFVRPRSL